MISVCIAHYKESLLDWINNIKYPVKVISKYDYEPEEKPNKGNEASSYLQYIVDNYDNLNEYTYFIHGHRNAYTHTEYMDEKLTD